MYLLLYLKVNYKLSNVFVLIYRYQSGVQQCTGIFHRLLGSGFSRDLYILYLLLKYFVISCL